MKVVRSWSMAAAMLLAGAASVSAQTPYVGASLFADVVRSSHTEIPGISTDSGSGEALGFTLRVGTPIGAAWGVEAEFARPATFDASFEPPVTPLASTQFAFTASGGVSGVAPIYPYSVETSERNTTFSTVAWVQQQLSSRVGLVYLGGLGFYRSEFKSEITFPRFLAALPVGILPFSTETVVYGVRPLAGMEARIELTEHAQLVPGLRLHGMDDKWLVRPSVGINWSF
jgi:hypothetical protein